MMARDGLRPRKSIGQRTNLPDVYISARWWLLAASPSPTAPRTR